MNFAPTDWQWIRQPEKFRIDRDSIEIITQPHTDLWQHTYYGFQNDNAPVLQVMCAEQYFSFTVKTQFQSKRRYDQCGVAIYIDSEDWLKASVEYEDRARQRLGSVVTNNGYSDWATTDIDPGIRAVWYRLSRREQDFRIEHSFDGKFFQQMRICHLFKAIGAVPCGIYACSPENSSFKATFSDMKFGECVWHEHK